MVAAIEFSFQLSCNTLQLDSTQGFIVYKTVVGASTYLNLKYNIVYQNILNFVEICLGVRLTTL